MNYSWCEFYLFAKDWQTLIGALIALCAAYLTIRQMRRQAEDDTQRHENLFNRKKMASRARIPDALSGICQYAEETGRFLTGQINDMPEAPIPSIETLKQVIEHIDDDAAERSFELMSWYQVQRARLQGYSDPQHDVGPLYDIVLLQAYVNSLFDYGRNEAKSVPVEPPTRDEMKTAKNNVFELHYVMAHEEQFTHLDERILKRH